MVRNHLLGSVLIVSFMLMVCPGFAQDHTGHQGHEKQAAQEPAAGSEMDAPTIPLPEKLVDVRYKVCPILGNDTQEGVAAIHEGKVYHFCCEACVATFKKDPAGVIAKIEKPEELPLTITNKDGKCPVTGEAATAAIFLVRGNNITFYCCGGCVGKDQLASNTPVIDKGKPEGTQGK